VRQAWQFWYTLCGPAFSKFGRAKSVRNWARFWTALDFDRERLRNGLRCQKSEKHLNVAQSGRIKLTALLKCAFKCGFAGELFTVQQLSPVLVIISSKSVSICNRSHDRLVDSSRNHAFWRGYPTLMPSYGRLLEPSGSKLTRLKSKFNAENFVCKLCWSI